MVHRRDPEGSQLQEFLSWSQLFASHVHIFAYFILHLGVYHFYQLVRALSVLLWFSCSVVSDSLQPHGL